LASDVKRLTEIRSTLRETMLNSYLCDGQSFTANLEAVYRQLWVSYCRGENEVGREKEVGQARSGVVPSPSKKKHKNKDKQANKRNTKKNKNEGKENGDGNTIVEEEHQPQHQQQHNHQESIVVCLEPRKITVHNVNTMDGEDNNNNIINNNNSTVVTEGMISKKDKSYLLQGRVKMKGRKKTKQQKGNHGLLSPSSLRKVGELVEGGGVASPSKEVLTLATTLPDNSHNSHNSHNVPTRQQGATSRSSPIPIPKKGQRGGMRCHHHHLSRPSQSLASDERAPSPPNSPSLVSHESAASATASSPPPAISSIVAHQT